MTSAVGSHHPPGPNVVLLRHGETAWSLSGQHTGRTDMALTELGDAEARAQGARLSGRQFSLVLSSPLQRAARTAELAGLTDVVADPDLCEWDYGDFEGLTTPEIQELIPGWSIWTGPWPGGESIDDVAGRADRVVARLRTCPPGATAAVVGHGHQLRILAARWLGAEAVAGRWLALGTASISELGWEHATAVVQHWNT
jgi:broad specificity phosphatase PhoE